MNRKTGFVSVGVLITMLLVLAVASMGLTSTSGLRKTHMSSVRVKENYIIGENFMTYYQTFIAEKIKEIYLTTPYDLVVVDYVNDLEKMNFIMLNRCYGALTEKWYYEFKTAMMNEDTKGYLGYEMYSLQLTKEYYDEISKKYIANRYEIENSDFRVIIKMILIGENGKQKQLDTIVYFYIPDYNLEQMKEWTIGEKIELIEGEFEDNTLIKVGDTVVSG